MNLEPSVARLALKLAQARKDRIAAYHEELERASRLRYNVTYCVHGTYVGDPYGPDYMCGPCESGEREDIYGAALAESKRRHAKTAPWMSAAVTLHTEGLIDNDTLKRVFSRVFEELEV